MKGDVAKGPGRALFLHGAGAWGGQWAIWQRVFEARGWTVACPDRQPAPGGLVATRWNDYHRQGVAALRNVAGPQPVPVLLVGASLGGLLALAAGSEQTPSALVLVNPLPPAPWAAGLPPDAFAGDLRRWRSEGRFESTRRALPQASFADAQRAFRAWRDESAAVLREARAGLVLPVPTVPVLVIAGCDDTVVPVALSAAFAAAIAARFEAVPGDHLAPVMGASAVLSAECALAWFAGLASARVPR